MLPIIAGIDFAALLEAAHLIESCVLMVSHKRDSLWYYLSRW